MRVIEYKVWGIILPALVLVGGCSDWFKGRGDEVLPEPDSGEQIRLKTFDSDEQLLKALRTAARTESQYGSNIAHAETAAVDTTASAASGAGAAAVTSGTNVQVTGVDEADLIEVNDELLYALHSPSQYNGDVSATVDGASEANGSQLLVFALSAPAERLQRSSLPSGVDWNGLYFQAESNQLLVQGESYSSAGNANATSYWWGGASVELESRRVSTDSGLLQAGGWALKFDGRLVGSRLIGNTLYLVTDYGAPYIYSRGDQEGNIDALELPQWLPHWSNSGQDQGAVVESADCYAVDTSSQRRTTRVTTVLSIPLDRPTEFESLCLLGSAETVYVSRDALYIASTSSYYEAASDSVFIDSFPSQMTTDVHKFSLAERLNYRGGVHIAGHLGWHPQQRSYRLGERDGVLSVVTSGAVAWGARDQKHRLFNLAEAGGKLSLMAQLPNEARPDAIGKPGERIYSTRLVGDKMYVVTFLNTDPLYVIDVANPEQPFIAGSLEIPGFSDYLHPVAGGRLLGIGKSAKQASDGDAGRGAWYQGLRVSLFEVNDPSNPRLLDALEFGDRGSSTDVSTDFHALAWLDVDATESRFAFPVNLHQYASPPLQPWAHADFLHRGLYQFQIDDSGLSRTATAIVPTADSLYSLNHRGRSVLASDGSAWFYDQGELYYIASDAASIAVPSIEIE